MEETGNEKGHTRTRFSCIQCQHFKKKCDRRKPTCSLCLRHQRECLYNPVKPLPQSSMVALNSSQQLESVYEKGSEDFPAVFFLDSALFHRSMSRLPDLALNLDATLIAYTRNHDGNRAIATKYFKWVHPWLPFLSRQRFMERVLNPLSPRKPANMLLLSAMKLLATPPPQDIAGTTDEYHAIKTSLLRADACNMLDFTIFQVKILVALYELGHAIFPAAYLSIGYCIRYGNALGVNTVIDGGTHSFATSDSVEMEEQRRSWWALLILDRYISLGCPEHASLVTDPASNSILPMDDASWDKSDFSAMSRRLLSSAPTEAMGRFSLTAQAAILLGRVFRNVQDSVDHDGLREQDAKVLDKTLIALTNVSLQEGRFRGVGVCSPTTICYSARLLLHDISRLPTPASVRARASCLPAKDMLAIAASMLKLGRAMIDDGCFAATEASPFCFEATYRSALFYAGRYAEAGQDEDLKAFQDMKAALAVGGSRWRAPAVFLQMIEARDSMDIL